MDRIMNSLFDGWAGILEITIAAPMIYIAIICVIRVSGKRSTSQMNNFDWVVTVALGSIAASGVMLKDVSVVECLYAISLLLAFQWLLTKSLIHLPPLQKLVKANPTLLVHNGEYILDAMKCERVAKDEILAAIRESGLITIEDAKWVILETDASFSVIPQDDRDYSKAAFQGVTGFPPNKQ